MHYWQRKASRAMLRITYAETNKEQRWTLCGQLAGPEVAELRGCWEYHSKTTHGLDPVLDLSDVTFIDESGEKLLLDMRSSGARFVAAGVATKHLLDNLRARGKRTLRRVIAPPDPREEHQ